MMQSFPLIIRDLDSLIIRFVPELDNELNAPAEMILDFDSFNDVIGIEIIGLCFFLERKHLTDDNLLLIKNSGIRHSYDPDSDAFYLKLKNVNSTNQKSVDGAILLNNVSKITGFRADLCMN